MKKYISIVMILLLLSASGCSDNKDENTLTKAETVEVDETGTTETENNNNESSTPAEAENDESSILAEAENDESSTLAEAENNESSALAEAENDDNTKVEENVKDNQQFQVQEPIKLDYAQIYGGIMDSVISEVAAMGGHTGYLQYTLYDIEKDGYLEFFIQKGTCEADMSYVIYSTNGRNAIKLGEIHAGHTSLYEKKDGNGFYTDYGQMGYECISYVCLENGKLKEESVFDGEVVEYGYSNDGVPFQEVKYPMEMYSILEGPISSSAVIQNQNTTQNDTEYILPDSDKIYYNEQELFSNYEYDTLRYAKNEIYARHGYIFQTEEYRNYFESMTWYLGTTSAGEFTDTVFNEYEKHNIQAIQRVLDYYEN